MGNVRDERILGSRQIQSLMGGVGTRRSFLKRAVAIGLASPAIAGLLAACGGGSTPATSGSGATAPSPTSAGSGPATGASPTTGTSGPTSANKEFVVLLTGAVPDVDPQSAYDNAASSLFFGTYEMLIRFDGESTTEFVPMLAKSWEQSADLKEFTFVIDKGIKFHDGSDCDAQSVKDSFYRLLNMARGPVSVISRFVSDADKQITVVDATTVKFTMNKPEPLFMSAMASEYGPFVMSMKAMAANKTDADPFAHEWFSQNMVGTGPYKVTEAAPQDRFVLDRFDGYHSKAPFFDRLVFRVVAEDATRRQLMESGEAHGVTTLPAEDVVALQTNPATQVVAYDSTRCDWIRMNYVTIADPKVRLALTYAWPFDDVIEFVLKGFGKVQGPIADTVIGFDPKIPVQSTDLDKAKSLLAEAGVKDGETYVFMYAAGSAQIAAMAQLYQASLKKIGINLDIQQVDRGALLDLNYGDKPATDRPHFVSTGWWPDYNDPWSQFYPNFHTKSIGSKGANSSYYSNKDADALMDKLEVSSSIDEIVDLTGKTLQILMWDDPAGIFYAQIKATTILAHDIRGFVPNGIYINSYNFNEMFREG